MKPEFALCARGNLDEESVKKRMDTGNYVMEPKFDGVRVMVVREGGTRSRDRVQILTRAGTNLASKFPNIVDEVLSMPGSGKLILDGELTASDLKFVTVQRAIQSGDPDAAQYDIQFYPFDVLHSPHTDEPTVNFSYEERHGILGQLSDSSYIDYVKNHKDDAWDGIDLYQYMKDHGKEGVILKHRDSIYRLGHSANWLRSKFTDTISVLPLDVNDSGTVDCMVYDIDGNQGVYVGAVQVPDIDLVVILDHNLNVVLEIEAYGVSADGVVRHPVYKGMRFDIDRNGCPIDQLDKLRRF